MSEFRNQRVIETTIFKDNVRDVKIEGLWVVIYTKDTEQEPYLNACISPEKAVEYRDEIINDLATKGFHLFKDLRAEWDDDEEQNADIQNAETEEVVNE